MTLADAEPENHAEVSWVQVWVDGKGQTWRAWASPPSHWAVEEIEAQDTDQVRGPVTPELGISPPGHRGLWWGTRGCRRMVEGLEPSLRARGSREGGGAAKKGQHVCECVSVGMCMQECVCVSVRWCV